MDQRLVEELNEDAPPSTVDDSGIIRRERRRRTTGRFGAAASAASVVAVASAVAVLGLGGGPAPSPVSGPAHSDVSRPASAGPGAASFRLAADGQGLTATTTRSLQKALRAAVAQKAPGTKWLDQYLHPETESAHIADRMISLAGRRGSMYLTVTSGKQYARKLAASKTKTLFFCFPSKNPEFVVKKCAVTRGANGRLQKVETWHIDGTHLYHVTTVELADGGVLSLQINNSFNPYKKADDSPAQTATPWSAAQVTAIATTVGNYIVR